MCSGSQGHREDPLGSEPCTGFLLKYQMLSAKQPGLCGQKVSTERLIVIFAAVQQNCKDGLTYPFILSSLDSLSVFARALGCHLFYCPNLNHRFVSDLLLKQPDL